MAGLTLPNLSAHSFLRIIWSLFPLLLYAASAFTFDADPLSPYTLTGKSIKWSVQAYYGFQLNKRKKKKKYKNKTNFVLPLQNKIEIALDCNANMAGPPSFDTFSFCMVHSIVRWFTWDNLSLYYNWINNNKFDNKPLIVCRVCYCYCIQPTNRPYI